MLSIDRTAEEAKCEDLVKIIIGDDPENFFQIGSQLPQQEREELIEFLKQNIDVFAWNTYEAPRVDPEFICHHLNVNPLVASKKQPPRTLASIQRACKSSFFLIVQVQRYLMITLKSIQETHPRMADSGVY